MNSPRSSQYASHSGNGILGGFAAAIAQTSTEHVETLLAREVAKPAITPEQAFRILKDCGTTIAPAYQDMCVLRCWNLVLNANELEFFLRVNAHRNRPENSSENQVSEHQKNSENLWSNSIGSDIEQKVVKYFEKTYGLEFGILEFEVFKALVNQPDQKITFDFEAFEDKRVVLGAYFPKAGLAELHKIAGSEFYGLEAKKNITDSYKEGHPRNQVKVSHRNGVQEKSAQPAPAP